MLLNGRGVSFPRISGSGSWDIIISQSLICVRNCDNLRSLLLLPSTERTLLQELFEERQVRVYSTEHRKRVVPAQAMKYGIQVQQL